VKLPSEKTQKVKGIMRIGGIGNKGAGKKAGGIRVDGCQNFRQLACGH